MIEWIPSALRELDQWVLWRYVDRDGKPSKCPFQVSGVPAKVNDSSTWSSFDDAANALGAGYEGLGFVFTPDDPYCGIDFDGCRDPETGKTQTWAVEWMHRLKSYCEVSPSGSGWKVFGIGSSIFPNGRKQDLAGDPVGGKSPGVEIYDHSRWFAITGQRGRYHDVVLCQAAIDDFCRAYWPEKKTPTGNHAGGPADVIERARRYASKLPPAISGQSGHNAAFHTACVLVLGFGLSPEHAFPVFSDWNQTCQPPWSDREMWHKLRSADQQAGERCYLRNAREQEWHNVTVPDYRQSPEPSHPQFVTLRDAATQYLDRLQAAGGSTLIDIGIPEVSYALGGGVEQGELVLIGARPSHGKSAVALQILQECSSQGHECLIVSEEMSIHALGKRTVQYVSDVHEEHHTYDRAIIERQLERHFRDRKNVHIIENCRTAKNVDAAIDRAVSDHGVSVVAVDYAQLLAGKGATQYERVSAVSRDLAAIAHVRNVLLIVLCQLSREIEKRERFTPKITDLRDSGQLEQDADVILFTVWPHRLDPKLDPFEYQVFVAKNRHRPIHTTAVSCRFEPSRQRFVPEPVAQPRSLDTFN